MGFPFSRKSKAEREIRRLTEILAPYLESKPEERKKVSDHDEIKKNIRLESESDSQTLERFCVIHEARIICHSVLIDKLGDLTKFIITSLYAGYSIEEISALTQMGATTIKEEIEYLIRGGLVNDDKASLTELGSQYGRLFEIFHKLSEGISVAFNTFADLFEPIENEYCQEADPKYVLPKNYIHALARNDNYANSLDIAVEQIEEDTPFSQEIKKSLYVTVKIENSKPKYKRIVINDFSKGLESKKEEEACIKVAIPCDRAVYRPRYSRIDSYRDVISTIIELNKAHNELLSDKARTIINDFTEEEEAEAITIDVNTVTGELINECDNIDDLPEGKGVCILDRRKVTISLDPEACEGLYLKEVDRKELYKIRYFPYSETEAQ